jgi:hypothetical protein
MKIIDPFRASYGVENPIYVVIQLAHIHATLYTSSKAMNSHVIQDIVTVYMQTFNSSVHYTWALVPTYPRDCH